MHLPIDFFDLSPDALATILEEHLHIPRYRWQQLYDWVYRKKVHDFHSMTNLGRDLRPRLAESFFFPAIAAKDRQISNDGTRKYLFEVDNGDCVETVMVKQPKRLTLCVSSQVGCAMGCSFCRTGTMGLLRNLRTSEIIRQILGVIEDAKNFNDTFQNIVFMGMGEPLHNVTNVIEALRILTSHFGLAIPPRKITVSTVGILPAIMELAKESGLSSLAVSLNATTDEVRSEIMPVNKRYPLDALLDTLRHFPIKGRKKITIEYVLLSGINDTDADLKRLPKLLRGIPCKVNLIPYNENAGLGFKSPPHDRIDRWYRTLCEKGVDSTIRWSKGQDISAACGQLASQSTLKRRSSKSTGK